MEIIERNINDSNDSIRMIALTADCGRHDLSVDAVEDAAAHARGTHRPVRVDELAEDVGSARDHQVVGGARRVGERGRRRTGRRVRTGQCESVTRIVDRIGAHVVLNAALALNPTTIDSIGKFQFKVDVQQKLLLLWLLLPILV